MRKKLVITLLYASMFASMLTAWGSNSKGSSFKTETSKKETVSDSKHYSMLDMSNMTIYVSKKAVDYIQKKIPEATVKAKDSF